jgi:hypothetical protein
MVYRVCTVYSVYSVVHFFRILFSHQDSRNEFDLSNQTIFFTVPVREYELITEAHAQLSVVRNCSRSSLRVCVGEGKQLAGGGRSAVAGGGGR